MNAHEKFVDVLRTQMENKNASIRATALRSGVPVRSLHSILNDGRVPSINRAEELCRTLDLEFYIGLPREGANSQVSESSATHSVDTTPNVVVPFDPNDHEAEHALIPKLDVKASAGSGAVADNEQPEGLLAFRRDWLRKRGLRPDYLNAIEVTGDSMVPTFNEGDTILVDRSRPMPPKIGTVVVARLNDNEIVIKRLSKLSDEQYLLTSDNPIYNPVALKKTDVLVGEVVWRGIWMG